MAPQIHMQVSFTAPASWEGEVALAADHEPASPLQRDPRVPNPGNGLPTPYHDGRRPIPGWLHHAGQGL